YSAEFSQYRHYRPGDDLKYIDWKLFARTDRLYTKQFRETTNLLAQIAVDTSASMDYAGAGGVTKFQYARLLAAALAHLVSRQGARGTDAAVPRRRRGCGPGKRTHRDDQRRGLGAGLPRSLQRVPRTLARAVRAPLRRLRARVHRHAARRRVARLSSPPGAGA